MIDPNLLRANLHSLAKKLAYKNFNLNIEEVEQQEKERKILQIEAETLRAKRNLYSKNFRIEKFSGRDCKEIRSKVNEINKKLISTEKKLDKIKRSIFEYALSIPNLPSEEIPVGNSNKDDVQVFLWGKPKFYNFPVKDHVEIGRFLNEMDFTSATKITGNRFVVIKGQLAKLYRSLVQFMIDLHVNKHGYEEYYVPYIVNQDSLYGTGQLPKFKSDLFHIKSLQKNKINSYALIPTAEVPLINLARNKIFSEKILPIKMVSHTPCFRSEAGSYGRDTKGLIRMHQFDKVEMVQIVKPIESMEALEEVTEHAEKVLQLLNLPYRRILLCTGNTSFSSCKTYDLEAWFPSVNSYREVSSCSNTGDFQSRRIKARYREHKNGGINLVHTVNGSGLAVGRTFAAILENYQLPSGNIEIPEILGSYMKK